MLTHLLIINYSHEPFTAIHFTGFLHLTHTCWSYSFLLSLSLSIASNTHMRKGFEWINHLCVHCYQLLGIQTAKVKKIIPCVGWWKGEKERTMGTLWLTCEGDVKGSGRFATKNCLLYLNSIFYDINQIFLLHDYLFCCVK
jgi:hypothetical protein